MAEALKDQFGPEVAHRIAQSLLAADPAFPAAVFLEEALSGYSALELMPRAQQLATALHRALPSDYKQAIQLLLRSIGPRLEQTENNGLAPFFYLPHIFYIARFGLDHFEESMAAQYELTQRFTAEFSIRPFIERYPETTFARLLEWTRDPNVHVRRLVSEGTRPRLPWAPRLRQLQADPSPSIALLELLKDDPDLYVRRSVANHLNDIGKDHPEVLVQIAKRWSKNASPDRLWLIRHGLRSLVKQGHPGALEVLGFSGAVGGTVLNATLSPVNPAIGESVVLSFTLRNDSDVEQKFLVDFRIFFVKTTGQAKPKVFKLKSVLLAPNSEVLLSKKVSLAEMTTRKHYPGTHHVEILINGQPHPAGSFFLK